MDNQHIQIREAQYSDLENIFSLVKELAEYEKAPLEVTAHIEDYHRDFKTIFDAFVAYRGNECIGMALYYWNFSTWKGKMLYLEDFYVLPSYRRTGVGRLLFEQVIEKAEKEGAALMKWQVLDWNQLAIDFYEKYDTIFEDNWLNGKIIFKK
jgi:GNAT superfamily N-acetyltransferase